MKTALLIASGAFAAALAAAAVCAPVQAKTMKECAAQWQEMKTNNQTEGMKYRDFSKKCMSEGAPAADNPPPPKPEAAAPPAAGGNAVFPSAVSSKYSSESAGKARDAHLPRSVPRQQGQRRQRRLEVDPKGRRLLQRVQ